jgi:hypothetical protein
VTRSSSGGLVSVGDASRRAPVDRLRQRQTGQPFLTAGPYPGTVTAESATDAGTVAERVVLRYQPATDTVRRELTTSRYAAYLRRTEAGPVVAGDEWRGFVNCGCGTTEDVVLTVESVAGGDSVGDGTAFEFVPAEDG